MAVPDDRPADAPPPRGRAAALLRVYARAFLSQGVGLVGLAWCLAANLPWAALGLTILVFADQAMFLRGRAPLPGRARLQAGLDAWCLGVSALDILLLLAAAFRATGLREIGGGPVGDPASSLAFAAASVVHLDLGLAPVAPAGRLLAAAAGLFGAAAFLAATVTLVTRTRLREGVSRR